MKYKSWKLEKKHKQTDEYFALGQHIVVWSGILSVNWEKTYYFQWRTLPVTSIADIRKTIIKVYELNLFNHLLCLHWKHVTLISIVPCNYVTIPCQLILKWSVLYAILIGIFYWWVWEHAVLPHTCIHTYMMLVARGNTIVCQTVPRVTNWTLISELGWTLHNYCKCCIMVISGIIMTCGIHSDMWL